jgi:hypothetical protein
MPITKGNLDSQSVNQEMEVLEIPPLVKDGNLGKYVFLYDYETNIFTPEANSIMQNMPLGGAPTPLPKGSSFTLKYSKGDVVNVVDFRKIINDKGITTIDKSGLVINVPVYVKPKGVTPQSFAPTFIIDNSQGSLQKVAESTPITTKLGIGFGKNPNPKMQPVLDNPITTNPTPTPSPTPVISNGVEDTSPYTGFFSDTNNLLLVGVVLVIGYLLINDKNE